MRAAAEKLPVIRAALAILAGFGLSLALYHNTHDRRVLPELFGIAAGCLLVDAVICLLWRDEEAALKSFVAQSLVGLGVAANRVRLTAAAQLAKNGKLS